MEKNNSPSEKDQKPDSKTRLGGARVRAPRAQPELSLELLAALPGPLGLRLCSQLAAIRPDFAAQGWIMLGCLAHEERSGAFEDSEGDRSWEKYPSTPLALASAERWPELLACLKAMGEARERAVELEAKGERPAGPFKEKEPDWRSKRHFADLMSESEFLSELVERCSEAPEKELCETLAAALEACGWSGPAEGREISERALGELAWQGQGKALGLAAKFWNPSELDWRSAGRDARFFAQGRISSAERDSGSLAGLPSFRAGRSGEAGGSAGECGSPWVKALAGKSPAATIAVLNASAGPWPNWGETAQADFEARWALQSPDEAEAMKTLAVVIERGGLSKVAASDLIGFRSLAMAMLDRVAAGDADRAERMLTECVRLGAIASSDPCDAMLGGPVSLASMALSMGRLDMAKAWIERREKPLGPEWIELAPVTLLDNGALLNAGSAAQTPCLVKVAFGERGSAGSQTVRAHHSDGPDTQADPGQSKDSLAPLTAALLAEDLGLARALMAKLPDPEADHRWAIERARFHQDTQRVARLERAWFELETTGAAPATKRKGGLAL